MWQSGNPMNETDAPLRPDPPFVWPEPRVVVGICAYPDHEPPFNHLALSSDSVVGIVSAPRADAADVIDCWLNSNAALKARLVVAVYPTCLTRREDLSRLVSVTDRHSGRIVIRIKPYDSVIARPTNALCFQDSHSGVTHLVTGPTENLGLAASRDGQVNFVMGVDPVLLDAFSQYFALVWASATDVSVSGIAQIPHLVLPPGDQEGARLWREYVEAFDRDTLFADRPLAEEVRVDAQTGGVQIVSGGTDIRNPTEDLGISRLDPLAEKIARLYQKGVLVSVDKLTRIPPLDAPVDPSVFGDSSEIQQGNVTRRVNVRVSIIDEETLTGIEHCRQALRPLLSTLTFGLAENMRWMPHSARELLELELSGSIRKGRSRSRTC